MGTKIIYVIFISLAIGLSMNAAVFANKSGHDGRAIFTSNCARCHGENGARGKFGAKDLQKSKLTDMELVNIIANGKRVMPSWKKKLNEEQIRSVKDYIKTFRR
jgi:cytochrome c6